MTSRAVSTFEVTGWDQKPYDDGTEGAHLSRATVRKTFEGDMSGESIAELLMCQADTSDLKAGAGYVASERVEASLCGRAGTFVLQHWGVSGGAAQRTGGHVVPGSGSGGLTGIAGTVEISVDPDGAHTLTFDYDLP